MKQFVVTEKKTASFKNFKSPLLFPCLFDSSFVFALNKIYFVQLSRLSTYSLRYGSLGENALGEFWCTGFLEVYRGESNSSFAPVNEIMIQHYLVWQGEVVKYIPVDLIE